MCIRDRHHQDVPEMFNCSTWISGTSWWCWNWAVSSWFDLSLLIFLTSRLNTRSNSSLSWRPFHPDKGTPHIGNKIKCPFSRHLLLWPLANIFLFVAAMAMVASEKDLCLHQISEVTIARVTTLVRHCLSLCVLLFLSSPYFGHLWDSCQLQISHKS